MPLPGIEQQSFGLPRHSTDDASHANCNAVKVAITVSTSDNIDKISYTQMPTTVELILQQWLLKARQIAINITKMADARTCGLKTTLVPSS